MTTTTFTQLSESEIRALLRAELEAFFRDKFPVPDHKGNPPALGGIDLAEEVTGLRKPSIYALVQRREIPFMKKGKKLYFKRGELEAWIESGRKPTAKEVAIQVEAFTARNHNRK